MPQSAVLRKQRAVARFDKRVEEVAARVRTATFIPAVTAKPWRPSIAADARLQLAALGLSYSQIGKALGEDKVKTTSSLQLCRSHWKCEDPVAYAIENYLVSLPMEM